MLYFIVNKNSRTGKAADTWKLISRTLTERAVSYKAYETKYAGHAKVLAAKICSLQDPDICLVIVGGDGTINEVLSGIYDQNGFDRVRIGVIPNGSGNDFGNGMKLSADPVKNLNLILKNEKVPDNCRKLDLGFVSGSHVKANRIFAISSGVGMDAIVCKEANETRVKTILNRIHLGQLTYVLLTLYTLFSMETMDMEIRYTLADGAESVSSYRNVIFAAAMNLPAEGGGVPMAPNANIEDGLLDLCIAYGIPKWRTFFYLPLLVAGKHQNIKGFELKQCEKAVMYLSKPSTVHADGEYCGELTQMELKICKGILKFMQ